jgi:predicted secreted protein
MVKKWYVWILYFFVGVALADKLPIYTEKMTTITPSTAQPAFIVELKSNRTTGYSWFLETYDPAYLDILDHRYVPSKSMVAGAGSVERWTFRLTEEALTVQHPIFVTLAYAYKRPWEKDVEPKRVIFQVVKK